MSEAKTSYRPDIDGLRALAVVSVLLFHGGVSVFSGGYVGVDIFFVISGFVIALSINRDLERDQFSLSGFYERRARRILPALTVVLLATWAASLWLAPPVYFESFAKSLAYAASFLSNVHFWRESGYFTSDSPFRPLLHTWSLAVEEQYYLLAPILLFLIYRFLGRKWVLGIAPILIASFVLGVYEIARQHIDPAFYLLPTRAWEILLGALIALSPPPQLRSRFAREGLSVIATALIAFAILFYAPDTPFPGFAALPPCLGAAILLYLGMSPVQPVVSRVLAWPPFVAIGLISYSLYLVHWPLMVLTRFTLARQMTILESAVALAACFALAGAMYVLVERPLRRAAAPRPVVFFLSAVAILVTVAAGVFGPALNQRIFAGSAVETHRQDWATLDKAFKTGQCLLVTGQPFTDWMPDTCARTTGPGADILLFGDSFAAHYAPGLEVLNAKVAGRVIQYSMQGCSPILENSREPIQTCREFNKNVAAIIEREQIKRVVIAASWLEYGADWSVGVESTLKVFRDMGLEVTLIGQSPNFYLEPFVIAAQRGQGAQKDVAIDIGGEAERLNARLRDLASVYGAHFIDPVAILCRDNLCPVRIDGQELFMDYGHFTEIGSVRAVRGYFPYLTQ
jgi:peptidoglycan/LPS O-acetylase OafA/YrhL